MEFTRLKKKNTKDQKIDVIMRFMAEFRFSSIEFLSCIIGQKVKSSHRFFKVMIKEEYLVPFRSYVLIDKADLVRMGPKAVEYLKEKHGINARAYARSDIFEDSDYMVHDLLLQRFIVKNLDQYKTIFSERNIVSGNIKPDALMFVDHFGSGETYPLRRVSEDNPRPVVIELERKRKSPHRIYATLRMYLDLLTDKKIRQVSFIFNRESHRDYYQSLFDKTDWDFVQVSSKTRRTKKTGIRTVEADDPLRKKFRFMFMDPFKAMALVPFAEE